jgi:putative ABC transport system ATP-binding protein
MTDPIDSQSGAGPLLRAADLAKTYVDGNVQALRGVSLELHEGESLAIVGPSGCGKSTLLHLLGGLDRPTGGDVFFRGVSLSNLDLDHYRAHDIGFVFQSFHLMPILSAVENVQVPMFESALSRLQRAERAEQLVAEVGMSHRKDQPTVNLSVGERQRIAIARALANGPKLLLADEPTGNLDSRSQADILELLAGLRRKEGLTLLIITHSPDVAQAADRIIHMRDGLIVDE